MVKQGSESEGEAGPDEAASDCSLLQRLRRGQADASTLLYLRYAGRLHALATKQSSAALARRVEPDEIVQSVFRTFFRRVAQGHYDVPAGEEIWKLLLVIALNKVRAAAIHHRDRYAPLRNPGDEVGSSVQGINHPHSLPVEPRDIVDGFLRQPAFAITKKTFTKHAV